MRALPAPVIALGPATAVRDAHPLARNLIDAHAGRSTVALSVHAFEQEMAGYAPEAVRESLRPLGWQRRMRGRLAFPLGRAALSAAGARSRRRDRVLER